MQNQESRDQISGAITAVVVEMVASLFRYPGYLNSLDVKPAGHPLLIAPYHLFRVSAEFATKTMPEYLGKVYSRKKQEIMNKRK